MLALAGFGAAAAQETTVEIAAGVLMPRINLGTCCGSEVTQALPVWLQAGGRGVDTAFDYGSIVPGGTQADIRAVLAASPEVRGDVFITRAEAALILTSLEKVCSVCVV